jgi:hypothetical protein
MTRKKKEAEIMGHDDENHLKEAETTSRSEEDHKERAEMRRYWAASRRTEPLRTVDNMPASHHIASIDPAISNPSDDDPASQKVASDNPAINSATDNIVSEAGATPASTAINKRTGEKASRKKAPQMAASTLIV